MAQLEGRGAGPSEAGGPDGAGAADAGGGAAAAGGDATDADTFGAGAAAGPHHTSVHCRIPPVRQWRVSPFGESERSQARASR